MLLKKIHPQRWFIWTLVLVFIIGFALIGYIRWVTIEMETNNSLLVSDPPRHIERHK